VLSVGLAAAGLTGADRVLTAADGGLLTACSDGGTPAAITEGLGTEWELTRLSLRARPGSSSVQSVGECALEHVARHGPIAGSRLTAARVRVPPSALVMCASHEWTDQLSAMQSAPFLVAALLAGHEWWVETFEPATRNDRALAESARRVEVVADPAVPLGGAAVAVRVDGAESEVSRPCALGDPGNPMDREAVEEKLRRACRSAPVGCDPESIVDAVRGLASDTGPDALLAALRLGGT
jgi:2-methylcitrate dehydratase PrpD